MTIVREEAEKISGLTDNNNNYYFCNQTNKCNKMLSTGLVDLISIKNFER